MPDLLASAITGLLSGGLLLGIAAVVNARSTARKADAEGNTLAQRLPAEIDSVVVQGAEQAVLTMRSALESSTRRIAELEADRETDRRRIHDLEEKVEQLREKVERAEAALSDASRAANALRAELESFTRDRDART